MRHHNSNGAVARKTRDTGDEPAFLLGRVAGILERKARLLAPHDGANAVGKQRGFFGTGAIGRVAHPQVIGAFERVGRHRRVGLGEFAPGAVDRHDRAGFVQNRDMRRKRIHDRAREAFRRISDAVEFLAQRRRRGERLLKQADTYLPRESGLALHLRLLFQGSFPDRCLENRLSGALEPDQEDRGGKLRAVDLCACPLDAAVAVPDGRFDSFLGQLGGITAVWLPHRRVLPQGSRHEVRLISGAEHRDRGRIGGSEQP